MKSRPLLFSLVSFLPFTAATGASLTWDGATSAFWNTTETNWSGSVWDSATPDSATFGAAGAGTVTIEFPGVTASAITFEQNGYIIDGDYLTLGGATTTLTTATDVSATISAILDGSAAFVKTGGGTLTLVGSNYHTGTTTISAGTLSISSVDSLGALPESPVADQLKIDGGILAVTVAGQALEVNRGITVGAAGATLDVSTLATSATTTINSLIAGTGPLNLKSSGDITPGGNNASGLGIRLANIDNSFTGDVIITAGLVSYAGNGAFGDAANKIILNGGGLLDNGVNLTLARDIQVESGGGVIRLYGIATATMSGAITGSGTLRHTDGGTLTLAGDLSGYSGTFNNQAGTLAITSTTSQSIKLTGSGTLSKRVDGTLTLTDSAGFSGQLNVSGNATTTPTLVLANTTGTVLPGNVKIGLEGGGGGGGTLQLGADNQLSAASVVTLTHAWGNRHSFLTLNGFSTQIAGLANGADLGGEVINGAVNDSTLTLAGAGNHTFGPTGGFHGTISNGSTGKLHITKTGSGTQTFSGGNTYTGATTVTNGTLQAGASTSVFGNNSAVTIADAVGAIVDLNSNNVSIGSLAGGGSTGGKVTLGAGTLTTGGDNISTTFAGIIEGTGGLTKIGTGTHTLTGAYSYAGLTTVYGATSSTLILAHSSGAALTGNIYIGKPFGGGSGGTLQLGGNNLLSSSTTVTFGHAFSAQHSYFKLNGFNTEIGGLANGSDLGGEVLNGAATDSTLTLAGSGTYTFGPISGFHGTIANGGTGKLSIVKSGTGTQTFTGVNSYTGNTTVTGGTLSLGTASLADVSTVSIGSGAILDLSHAATDTINALFVNGVQQPAGTYKSATGGGTGTVLASLTGTGSLQVTSGPSSNTFASWMGGYNFSAYPGADLTADGDADGDGISNLIEHVFGTAPNAATTGLTQVGAAASSLTFKHPLNANLAADVTYFYQWSSDLSEWKSSGQSNTGGTTATVGSGAPVAGEVTVTTAISVGPAAKLFVRVVASQAP